MRTTVAIDDPILDEIKAIQAQEGKGLGELLNELLILALALREKKEVAIEPFEWISKDMGTPLVDLNDKEALWAVLDGRAKP
jgi:hypothetical protein